MSEFKAVATSYRTTVFGLVAAVLAFLVQHQIGNVPIEQNLYNLALLLLGASAADGVRVP